MLKKSSIALAVKLAIKKVVTPPKTYVVKFSQASDDLGFYSVSLINNILTGDL